VVVELDPNFLLRHATYMPNGEIVEKCQMTVGQIIEGIAYAHINAKKPELKDRCKMATIKFEAGKFIVIFADDIEHLTF
jgi:hypothetical protein